MLALTAAVLLGYLLGSIPTGVVVGRHLGGIDIRRHGSGNPGAANTLRVLGPGPALLVFGVDLAKGWVAAWVGTVMARPDVGLDPVWWPAAAGAAAVCGHLWPVGSGFRGGKGVATAAGVALKLAPVAGALSLAVFALVVAWTRRVSVGSIAASMAFPLLLLGSAAAGRDAGPAALAFGAWFAVTVLWTHRSNLRRLAAGREPRLR